MPSSGAAVAGRVFRRTGHQAGPRLARADSKSLRVHPSPVQTAGPLQRVCQSEQRSEQHVPPEGNAGLSLQQHEPLSGGWTGRGSHQGQPPQNLPLARTPCSFRECELEASGILNNIRRQPPQPRQPRLRASDITPFSGRAQGKSCSPAVQDCSPHQVLRGTHPTSPPSHQPCPSSDADPPSPSGDTLLLGDLKVCTQCWTVTVAERSGALDSRVLLYPVVLNWDGGVSGSPSGVGGTCLNSISSHPRPGMQDPPGPWP